jgi:hypothetical protein
MNKRYICFFAFKINKNISLCLKNIYKSIYLIINESCEKNVVTP